MKCNCVVFDLDGTLLDTLGDLRDSVNFALSKNNLPQRTTEEIKAFVGNGIRLLIERSVPENTKLSLVDKCFEDFKAHYKANSANLTKAYDGINELLSILKSRGIKLAVVSNKADFAVQKLIKLLFDGKFDFVLGERADMKKKPAPDMVNAAIKHCGVLPEESVYVGDSEVDIETAKNSEIDCIIVDWGFREREFLIKNGAEKIVSSTQELFSVL